MKALRICLSFAIAGAVSAARADEPCNAPIKELQAGINEADFGTVRIKTEESDHIVKMKLISSLNEDWTSIQAGAAPSEISGYYGNGAEAKLGAQIIVRQTESGFEWALFRSDGFGTSEKGVAFFFIDKQLTCSSSDIRQWRQAVERIIGAPAARSVVNVSNDAL